MAVITVARSGLTVSNATLDDTVQTTSDIGPKSFPVVFEVDGASTLRSLYRSFDSNFGTHFYTASESERATIAASRPDVVAEGIGFYAPANATTTLS